MFSQFKRDIIIVTSYGPLPSHADILRGSLGVLAPQTSAESSVKKVDHAQHTFRSGKCTLDLEKFRKTRLQNSSERSRKVKTL